MPVIQSHDITLYGGNDNYDVVLRPLTDADLPYLYKWNADPDVTYFTESAIGLKYDEKTVRGIYGGVSQAALCFAVEANGVTVGDCWLQIMNIADVRAMYPPETDIRRIDMCIGEKEYWNKGIGSTFIRMLIDYAFAGEHVDVLHCFCEDYNVRSERMWQKNGYKLVKKEPAWHNCIGKYQLHYALTRQEYVENNRTRVPASKVIPLPLSALQPSQLYLSEGKLRLCREWFDRGSEIDPIPVRQFMNRSLMLDGHTRAAVALERGMDTIPCSIDAGDWDMAAYAESLDACIAQGVTSVSALAERIVSPRENEVLWRKRCMEKYDKPPYIYLKKQEEALFWTETPVSEDQWDIRLAAQDDLALFNRHLALCEQGPLAQGLPDYFLLFADGEPVARTCIEKIGSTLWELSDVRVAKPWREKGYGRAICAHVLNRILAAGHIATCRTMPYNAGMNAILKNLGFAPLYE